MKGKFFSIQNMLPKKGVYKRFLISYMVIMAFFIAALSFMSNIMLNSINEYDRNRQYQTADNANEMLNQQMQNIHNLCTQIKSDNDASYTSFLGGRKNLINVSEGQFGEIKKNIYEKIYMSVIFNNIVEDIYLFSAEDNSVIFSHGSVDLDVMYGALLKFGDMPLDEFRQKYLSGPKTGKFYPMIDVYSANDKIRSLLYVESYPDPFSAPTGYIVISLDLDEILNLLGYNEGDELFLYSPDDELLYSTVDMGGPLKIDNNGFCDINGKKYITYSSDNDDGINFVSAGLYNTAIKKTIRMRLFIVFILFCAVLVGLFLSVYFAKFNAKPIKGLIDKLQNVTSGDKGDDDEYSYISKSVDSIINDIMAIEKDFEEERPVLINDFVNSILLGKYMTAEETEKIATKLRVDISGKKFGAMTIRIVDREADNNREKLRTIQKSISAEYRHRFDCLTNISGMDSINIIFRSADEDVSGLMESIEDVTYTISDTLYENLQVRLKCSIGGFYDVITDMQYSYENVQELFLKGSRVEYRNVIWCIQSDDVLSWYYYPNEIEQRIENSFRSGVIEEIDHVLNLVKKENYVNRVLSSSTLALLYTNMKITVHNIMRQYCVDLDEKQMWKIVDDIDEGLGIEKFFEELSKAYRDLIGNSEGKSLKSEILAYVNKAALSVDFDRQTFANHFFISPDYVSKFFKENTGYGFTKYATKVRMDKACELLVDGNYNIERISEAVGYSSALSFRRAFKNYMGIPPSDYRANLIGSSEPEN